MDTQTTATQPVRGRSRKLLIAAAVAIAVAVGAWTVTAMTAKSHSKHVTEASYSDGPWPFTVAAVDLKCIDGGEALVRIAGVDYAFNGKAIDAGYPSFGTYWLDDPTTPGTKLPTFRLIMQAEDLC
jgi:flagellar basal body-associated protein FliL